jgi:hypothetical protein
MIFTMIVNKLEDSIEELPKLSDEIHFARNIIEHPTTNPNVSIPTYCFKIHSIEEQGRKIFNEDFPFKDYEVYFFQNLQNARRYAWDYNRSLYYLELAANYVRNTMMLYS